MAESRLVVNLADDGQGWAVRPGVGRLAVSTHATMEEAVERARADLRALPEGGELQVYNPRHHRLESQRVAPGSSSSAAPAPAAPVAATPAPSRPAVPIRGVPFVPTPPAEDAPTSGTPTLRATIKREGDEIDKWLGFGLPIAASFGAAFLSPQVAEADSWITVFLATLAWSLGWMLATYLLASESVKGVQAIFAVGICFAISIGVAAGLGVGVLEVAATEGGSPGQIVEWLANVARVAMVTYGFFGALFGAGVGLWLGLRFAQHTKAK